MPVSPPPAASRSAAPRPDAARDVPLLLAAGFARTLGVGMSGVLLLLALGATGLGHGEAYVALAAGLLGAAVGLGLVAYGADRWGRRRTLVAISCAQAVGGTWLAVAAGSFSWTVACAFLGMVNGMGRDRGPAVALEQAILPAATDDRGRTTLFAWYHLVLDAGHGLGALLPFAVVACLPVGVRIDLGAEFVRLLLALLGPLGLVSMLCHARLSPAAEQGAHAVRPPLSPGSRRVLGRLSALFALDSLGGGFLPNALLAMWFFERFGFELGALGLLFALGRVANALSYLAAARLARRIGLVRTMVFTHVPSSLILLALPLVDSAHLAVWLYLLRELLVEMDLPTRQSYTLAVVSRAEATRAASLTGLARACAWAVGAWIASQLVPHLGLSAPLLLGAGLKLVYDGLLFAALRGVRPPEERALA